MCSEIARAPPESIILLQGMVPLPNVFDWCLGCTRNPTGCDSTKEQWEKLCGIYKKKDHLPFFNVAYLGLASGSLEEDAYFPRIRLISFLRR